ncbi:AraC family transcriptional regulator [Actinoplanes sp. NBRC 14428]|uniref:AraC-like DNA-binding protein n=1 Tax=Pseudosporangium ferrugineum TaxID=439699 RepID=A0A2T0RKF4_9ACTN|nr:AraC family transcriptional regulator [Pseudosporangium ferrugineum]PRY21621.1 AraC-like DNA-binding protein [Pseudosporangium ferrugineum]BCJ49302.1 AraC family transcriptional regulator [Actinoplanes sp. NBRC 14428]
MDLTELRALLDRHARPDLSTPVEGVHISRVERTEPEAPSMTGTVLALIAQGAKRIALGDRIYEYGAGQYLVASVDLPVTGRFLEAGPDRPALGFGLTLHPPAVAELLLQAGPGDLPPAGPATPSGMTVSDAPAELIDAVVRLLRLFDRPRDLAVLAPMVKREILWRVVTGEQGASVRQLGLADSSLTHVARAVRWIREHYAESFRVEDVAQLSGMSVSAFYRNFQAVTAMSPIQFQKQIRLQEARLLLATHPHDITGVASRVGYDSPSQFSREYRRQFGAPPSRDATRLREAGPAVV